MADSIEMPFGVLGRVGPRNHVLDKSPDAPHKEQIFGKKRVAQCNA